MSHQLLMDMGNSRCKWALLKSTAKTPIWLEQGVWDNFQYDETHWVEQLESLELDIDRVLVSSVSSNEIKAKVSQYCQDVLALEPQFLQSAKSYFKGCKSLINIYQESLALGVDRWLAMLAAFERTDSAFAVLDAGTAITLDLVDIDGKHLGGHIVPGAGLMQKALFGDTGKIAFGAQLDPRHATKTQWLGENSQQAVELGCLQAAQAYLKSCLERLHDHYAINELYICGGDGMALVNAIEKPDNLTLVNCPELVLEGLFYQSKQL